ncbi:type VI secretion system ImpA family N-terminal domain-containing protein [Vibrio porteresiae]|uniref:Type VI secretion system ImpA family N-terminal domain-containing protein n=1 Tax=Vibrio porteresiae DSM 19223 TaxID=1123496 RepID=A0ABZ0QLE3_9VIBR|nr:type VI secretion system ImpA family N-terminal domain-containing protein [Vibrio porteresiae]WPC76866.1 type VI secretion system ImpA family N-terminal domain-containing protein [Vibrio porteresiae DSM 19223]
MSNVLFLDNGFYRLINDSEVIRGSDNYQIIRDEVNRRFNPLAGGTDWEKVFACCETLAKEQGLDLLMAGYFAVASLKVHGLNGFANGLEILLAALSALDKPDAKTAKMRKEVFDWVNGKVVPELKALKPNYEALRDLYRAERCCERLHQVLENQQPEQLVDFEGIGFALFEHIDRIETQYHTLVKRQQKQKTEQAPTVSVTRYRVTALITLLLGAIVALAGTWGYQHWFGQSAYAKQVDEPTIANLSQLAAFQNETSEGQRVSWQTPFIELYQASIQKNMAESIEQNKVAATAQVRALTQLYPQSESVKQVEQAFTQAQQEALAQTEKFIERFRDIRTKMANISLLAQKQRWSDLQKQTKSLEDFAVSLSPIYGRVDYVQSLIKQGDLAEARKEFSVLKTRLNNLSWQMSVIEASLQQIALNSTANGQ